MVTSHAMLIHKPQSCSNRAPCVVLQAPAMNSLDASTAADARDSTPKYNTRHQLGRPVQGEKPVKGGCTINISSGQPGAVMPAACTRGKGGRAHRGNPCAAQQRAAAQDRSSGTKPPSAATMACHVCGSDATSSAMLLVGMLSNSLVHSSLDCSTVILRAGFSWRRFLSHLFMPASTCACTCSMGLLQSGEWVG